jgi:hypothetical protein
MWGNACSGGPIWFLGLNKNGSFAISSAVDFCGGADPIILEEANQITIIKPGGLSNQGTGYIPKEIWIYKNGKVTRINVKK